MERKRLLEQLAKTAAENPAARKQLVPLLKRAWRHPDDDYDEPKDEEDDVDEYDQSVNYLNGVATKFPKKSAWWVPDHNMAINFPLLRGFNLWYYTILPTFPARRAYIPAGADPNVEPEGIVIHPGWRPSENDYPEIRLALVQKFVDEAKKAETVQAQTKRDFDWIESKFGIKIPSGIQAPYISQATKIATRRWAVDHLRVRDTFVPLDGRKPVDMPAFGRPRWY